jgi:ribonuclease P protein component
MRKTDEFSSVFRFRCVRAMAGHRFSGGAEWSDYSRLGMIVPKKVLATAVARNRVKRLIRE